MDDNVDDNNDDNNDDDIDDNCLDTPFGDMNDTPLSHHLGRLLMKSWLISWQMVVVARGSVASILMASTTRKYGTTAAH